MSLWNVPWLELAIFVPLLGALALNRIGNPIRAFWTGLAFSGASLIQSSYGQKGDFFLVCTLPDDNQRCRFGIVLVGKIS